MGEKPIWGLPNLFTANGERIGFIEDGEISLSCEDDGKTKDNVFSYEIPKQYSWNVTVDAKGVTEQLVRQLKPKSRVFTKAERKLFIRTVEHYGKVEFTMKDMTVEVDGIGCGNLTLVCATPAQVKCFLRMKDAGDFSYKTVRKNN